MPTKIAIVAGLSGAGKSTLLGKAGKGYKVANIGDLMLEAALRKGLAKDRDAIKRLSHGEVESLRDSAATALIKLKGEIILDTHMTIEKGAKLEPALPHSFMQRLRPARALIYINATSGEVMARRRKDRGLRSREIEESAALDVQRTVDLAILGYLSTHLNMPLYIIENREGHADRAAKELASALREAFGN